MSNKFFHGADLLSGDNTIPGEQIPQELKKLIPDIFKACTEFGLDFYPTIIQMLSYDEISEIAAYGGFPNRWPHWKWGMEYEELQRGYEHNMHRIYEMVINTNPCYLYCLNSNSIVDNVTVIAHALGHNDFFKNNIYFTPTNQNMMNVLANNGNTIRKYMARWGKERVTEFIDHCLRIETLIDLSAAWEKREIKDPVIRDEKKWRFPKRHHVDEGHEYMDSYLNNSEYNKKQKEKIARKEREEELGIMKEPNKNIVKFLRDRAPLKAWQADIIDVIYQEALYFAPQRITKMLNEGWASFVDYTIMCRKGLCGLGQDHPSGGIFEYAHHKMGVLGGKYSTNPYKLGFMLLLDIEERWNKGQFGEAFEECEDLNKYDTWDLKLGLGTKKIFEVRQHYNDLTALSEFFTPEFCHKNEFFNWKRRPNGDIVIEDRNFKAIKKKLLRRYANGGLPEIVLLDDNHRGKGYLLIEHVWEGQTLIENYLKAVMESICYLWNNEVYLITKDKDENELIYRMSTPDADNIDVYMGETYRKDFLNIKSK